MNSTEDSFFLQQNRFWYNKIVFDANRQLDDGGLDRNLVLANSDGTIICPLTDDDLTVATRSAA